MQIIQGRMLDQKIAQRLPHKPPRNKLHRITITNTGIDEINAAIGNKYVVTLDATVLSLASRVKTLSDIVIGKAIAPNTPTQQ